MTSYCVFEKQYSDSFGIFIETNTSITKPITTTTTKITTPTTVTPTTTTTTTTATTPPVKTTLFIATTSTPGKSPSLIWYVFIPINTTELSSDAWGRPVTCAKLLNRARKCRLLTSCFMLFSPLSLSGPQRRASHFELHYDLRHICATYLHSLPCLHLCFNENLFIANPPL